MLITVRFPKKCPACGEMVRKYDAGQWDPVSREVFHPACAEQAGMTKPRILLETPGGTKLEANFEFDPVIINAVRQVPGATWNKDQKAWFLPLSPNTAASIAYLISNLEFKATDAVEKKLVEWITKAEINILASRATDSDIKIEGLGGTLRPFQKGGVKYAVENERVIIADPPGLGKTVQGIGWVHLVQKFPVLVVAPKRALDVWDRHILGHPETKQVSWLPYIAQDEVVSLHGRSPIKIPDSVAFVLISWDNLSAWEEQIRKGGFGMYIFDEIHKAKNGGSARGRAAYNITAKSKWTLGLSGTPFLNRPEEIYQPLRILRQDKAFGDWWAFAHRYCNAHKSTFGLDTSGASNLDELNDRMRAICYVRRKREDVFDELPPKIRAAVPIRLSNWPEYQRAEADLAKWLGEQAAQDKEFLKSIGHLGKDEQFQMRVTRAKSVEQQKRRTIRLQRFWALKKLAAKGKMDETLKLIADLNEMGEKTVTFAWHRDIQDELAERIPNSVHIFSADSDKEALAAQDAFQHGSDVMNIICCFGANEAITLNASTNVVFAEFAWGPGTQEQAEDRVYRMLKTGAMNKATCHYTSGLETIDEEIIAIIDGKTEVVYAAADGGTLDEATGVVNHLVGKLIDKYKDSLKLAV